MPRPPSADVEQVIQGAPILQVPDPEATARHYRDVLGFSHDFGDADYSVVWRDNAAIHFTRGTAATGVRLFLWVRDADAELAALEARGVEIKVPIGDRPYGVRDFGIADCNGVDLVYGQDIDSPSP